MRNRIAEYSGYSETNLEPLQAVRYLPGQYYKPHHDYLNACDTVQAGNRHLTFLLYLTAVDSGGGTSFPRLNVTVNP